MISQESVDILKHNSVGLIHNKDKDRYIVIIQGNEITAFSERDKLIDYLKKLARQLNYCEGLDVNRVKLGKSVV